MQRQIAERGTIADVDRIVARNAGWHRELRHVQGRLAQCERQVEIGRRVNGNTSCAG